MPHPLVYSIAAVLLAAGAPERGAQAPVAAQELVGYELTEAVLDKFIHATRLAMAAIQHEPRFTEAPLFTRDILVSGDAPEMAAALQQRLERDPLLSGALFAADMHARDYTKFALTLFAARLAHGFVASGVLRAVPAGIAEHNVRFITRHQVRIAALLRAMGVQE